MSLDALIAWIRREPLLASYFADLALVAAGTALHHWGYDIPVELKTAIYGFIGAVSVATTVQARKSVMPAPQQEGGE